MKVERFTASWCGPCRTFAPEFNRVVEKEGLDATVYDVDTEEGAAKAALYGIKSIPAVFIDGQQIPHAEFAQRVEAQ